MELVTSTNIKEGDKVTSPIYGEGTAIDNVEGQGVIQVYFNIGVYEVSIPSANWTTLTEIDDLLGVGTNLRSQILLKIASEVIKEETQQ